MIDLPGAALDPASRELLLHPLVGGVILFSRNYESPSQVSELVASIHALRTTALLVAVDHEGGRVQRFREGFTRLPPVADLGRLYRRDPGRAREFAHYTGWLNAAELRACGIDLNFAPVLDLDFGVSSVIGDRAFARDPETVADLAHAYTRGMHDAGMSAVGKHFPGHGAIAADSHDVIAVDDRPYIDIRQDDLLAFERMMHYGLPAIMAAHVIYPQCDPQPAGFSWYWMHKVLRDEMGFQGAVFSDDLSMRGAHGIGDITTRTTTALEAGCDMALICNDRPAVETVLDELQWKINPVSNARLLRLQGHGHVARDLTDLHGRDAWRDALRAVNSYALTEELDLDV